MNTTYELSQASALNEAMRRLTDVMGPQYQPCQACEENVVDARYARICEPCWSGDPV